MAAASNKPVALQVWLIIFVLLTLVFAVITFATNRGRTQLVNDKVEAERREGVEKKLRADAVADANSLKTMIGSSAEQVSGAPGNVAGTVQGAVEEAMTIAGPFRGNNLIETVQKTGTGLATTDANRKQLELELQNLNNEFQSLKAHYEAIAAEHDNAKKKAESDLQDVIRQRDELLTAKDREIAAIRKEYNDSQAELQNLTEQRDRERKQFAEENARLEAINERMRTELDELKQTSFEVADGEIRRVDNSTETVWINLGSADNIRPRVTFSVYAKDNSGIGRGTQSIKGKIEVTRVIDSHMSQCKILDQDLYRPMAAGDQIYSPLWNPGRIELFSFVGGLDVDRDGRSDRALMHEIVATAGAKIDNEVDDDGNRIPEDGRINERTKFLVLGDIPDKATLTDPKDQERAQKIMDHLKEMRKEALLSGVRIVSLSDFLAYIGYKPKRRLFQPGQERPYNLTHGAHKTVVSEPVMSDRRTSGSTSGSIRRSKTQETAPGTTSKLYGAQRGY